MSIRSAVRRIAPAGLRRRALSAVVESPISAIAARTLPHTFRLEGCKFFAEGVAAADPRTFLMMLAGSHESSERRLALATFCSDWPIVDLGAGIGTVSVTSARALGIPFVVACEPNPDAWANLRRNMAVNQVDGVAVRAGIWYSGGRPTLTGTEGYWVGARMEGGDERKLGDEGLVGIDVPVITLRELVERYLPESAPFQLLCDIEGTEWSLMSSEADLLAQRCKRLVVEVHADPRAGSDPADTSTDALLRHADDLLVPLGFRRVASESVVAAYISLR